MAALKSDEVRSALVEALSQSREWAREKCPVPSALASSMFASEACLALGGLVDEAWHGHSVSPNFIKVNKDNGRNPGEWLLDGAWTEGDISGGGPVHIRCALECESNTRGRQFFRDFSKLVVVHSDTKIFLGGLDQTTERGARNYVGMRIRQCEAILSAYGGRELSKDWHIGFWPSPKLVDGESLWNRLDEYPHLAEIRLFSMSRGSLKEP